MDSFNQNNVKANLHDTNFSRIGIITLSTDFTIEQDFRKICHNLPVDLFFNRIPFLNPLTHENYMRMADHLTETTNQILPNEKIKVVAYGCTSGTIEIGEKRMNQFLPLTEVKNLIQTKYSITKDPLKTAGPATYVHCHETDQKIGFITPNTHNFCELCNRVRVTCTGEMYMCLGQQDKADLKIPLRKSENNQILKEAIYEAISRKPKGHDFVINRKKEEKFVPRHMNVTGG